MDKSNKTLIEELFKSLDFVREQYVTVSRNRMGGTYLKIIIWIYEPAYVAHILIEETTIQDLIKEAIKSTSFITDIYYV